MSVSVTIKPAGARPPALASGLPVTLEFHGKTAHTTSIGDVKAALQAKFPRFNVHRQKLSVEGEKATLADETTVAQAAFNAGKGRPLSRTEPSQVVLTVKDLGRQVSWRTVFLVEYAGPLIIHPLIYYFPQVFYRQDFEHSRVQSLVYALVLVHFLKRELETIFVHRFSHATMPFRNIFKNSAHYHILSGVFLAGAIYGPWYSASRVVGSRLNETGWLAGWAGLWLVSQFLNFSAHITLRRLRPAGTKKRGIPRGGLFELVSCPNYFAEILAWTAITGMTRSLFASLFLVVATGQMAIWALKKHKAYKREFGDKYPRGRKAMIPFIF